MSNPETRYFRPGAPLFKEGQESNSMFVIKKGTVSVRKMKGTAYLEIAKVYANEVIGELSFFDRQPRSATAVALTEVEALEIGFDSLEKIYAGIPDYLKTIMACVADRLRKANEMIKRLNKNVTYDEKKGAQADAAKEAAEKAKLEKETPDTSSILKATADIPDGEVSEEDGGEEEK